MLMYVGLHNHTDQGSNVRGFLDSTITVKKLLEYTHQLGHKGVAITDHDNIGAHVEALKQMDNFKSDESWKDYKLILGNEIYLCSKKQILEDKDYHFWHFILLAKDAIGHKQIRELSTRAWVENSFTYVNIRTPTYYEDLFEVIEENRGHIIASTACLGGRLAYLILQAYNDNPIEPNLTGVKKWLKRMDDCFGHGNFFLEMQPSIQEAQDIVNNTILTLSEELDIPFIISTDSHYPSKEDRPIHEAFLKSNEDSGKEREVGDFYATTYIMSEEEIHSYLDEKIGVDNVNLGINNTELIYNQVEDYTLFANLEIPYEPSDLTEPDEDLVLKYGKYIPHLQEFANSDYNGDRHLVREIVNRIEKDAEELANKETYEAIDTCLESIKMSSEANKSHWSAYLLQTRDLVNACWEVGSMVGPSRGSGLGFILLYILGITQVNPLREEVPTFHWRFLNPKRVSPLDIDVDFENKYRDDVIAYLQNKYCGDDIRAGRRRVMKVQTLLTMKAKNAIQTACRGLDIPVEDAQFLSSFIGQERGIQYTLKQVYYGDEENNIPPNTEFVNLMNSEKYKDVWKVAQDIEGLISGVGSHAGGVILSATDVVDHAALMKTASGDIITQFNLHDAEKCSLIKWDLLSIDALQKEHVCLNLLLEDGRIEWQRDLKSTYDKYLNVYTIDRDNPEIWKMINEHKIMSFFQMEKQTGYQALAIGQPKSLVDLSALNSVMRLMAPYPRAETPLERFGRFNKDISLWYKEMEQYGLSKHDIEVVKKYAEKSHGLLPNQEDFMQAVQDPEIGGFDLLWADKLRKSIA